ncbi:MAG: glycosyltransferase family 4 protein [Alphaproteobacteria bacterium]
MKIAQVCLAKKMGGLEQVFVDYGRALQGRGHSCLWVTRPGSPLSEQLAGEGWHRGLKQFGQFDPLAPLRLRKWLRAQQPDAVIAQGQRAIVIARKAAHGLVPVIAVNHGHTVSRSIGADAVIAISRQMREYYKQAGQPADRIHDLPNMIDLPEGGKPALRPFRTPPVIGSLGRLCQEKSFDVFLDVLAELKRRGTPFRAILGGDGELREALEAQSARLGLNDDLAFAGWLDGAAKRQFWQDTDIFCFTSHDDTAPLTLLEAPLMRVPLVMTTPPGPADMHIDGKTALMTRIGDVSALADHIQSLIENPQQAAKLSDAAYDHIARRHARPVLAEKLEAIVRHVVDAA